MCKNMVEPEGPQTTIRRMRVACWITRATDTHSENVTDTECLVVNIILLLHLQSSTIHIKLPYILPKKYVDMLHEIPIVIRHFHTVILKGDGVCLLRGTK
jgi:hypothetical protein